MSTQAAAYEAVANDRVAMRFIEDDLRQGEKTSAESLCHRFIQLPFSYARSGTSTGSVRFARFNTV